MNNEPKVPPRVLLQRLKDAAEGLKGINSLTPQDKFIMLGQLMIKAIDMAELSRSSCLTDNDWLQIEQASAGCIDGTSDDWPALRLAIEKITGKPFGYRKPASWLQGFCKGVMIEAGRERRE